ncbi:MAG: SPOR domain-containing protein [uncultured Sphingomonadaceae bacterium]|uniref:SPOR domain-containing protein n=1 Tax=uncultured Sphingomonadaceae bacterium TaxID=169976 RepID=A0A6J4TGQ0_9SPHN|nr:MAG: SPOR domain-containing protein [uncultured Sphingomonadaceae bacterium]
MGRHFAIAATSLALALLGSACAPMTPEARPRGALAAKTVPTARTVVAAEGRVAAAPRDAAERRALAEAYLRSGRFLSAAVTFSDVLRLRPDDGRAGLLRVLSLAALGEHRLALHGIDELGADVSPADRGLAFALAGDPRRGAELLEAAARASGADARTRQNLALAYALDGRWAEARAVAAQDVSPAELDGRMLEWAAFARPSAPHQQVAWMLGVQPTLDPGQPVRLALRDEPGAAFAEARDAAAVPMDAPAPDGPVAPAAAVAAAAAPMPPPMPAADPGPASAVDQALARMIAAQRPMAVIAQVAAGFAPRPATAQSARQGRFVVQLGAFDSAAMVDEAWRAALRRFSGLSGLTPASAQVVLRGRRFHRLAATGFATNAEAQALCRRYQAEGGQCFARPAAGDQPLRRAARGA